MNDEGESFEFETYLASGTPRRPYDIAADEFGVWLPHQCDEWIIGQGTRAETAAALRRFIAEAEAVLRDLEAPEAPGCIVCGTPMQPYDSGRQVICPQCGAVALVGSQP